jgi:hypothetical protein
MGDKALLVMLIALENDLQGHLDWARQATGGRPTMADREAALTGLGPLYVEIVSSRLGEALGASGFLEFCAVALPAVGVDTIGLKEAVDRHFKRWAKQQQQVKA